MTVFIFQNQAVSIPEGRSPLTRQLTHSWTTGWLTGEDSEREQMRSQKQASHVSSAAPQAAFLTSQLGTCPTVLTVASTPAVKSILRPLRRVRRGGGEQAAIVFLVKSSSTDDTSWRFQPPLNTSVCLCPSHLEQNLNYVSVSILRGWARIQTGCAGMDQYQAEAHGQWCIDPVELQLLVHWLSGREDMW